MWVVDYHLVEPWLDTLDQQTVASIFAALEKLAEAGPALGRPLVDTLQQATLKNLKELRPASSGNSEVRILFAFDPARQAILLLGGDKSRGKSKKYKWNGWYRKAVPLAEQIYRNHLDELERRNEDLQRLS
ncbi:MAG: type II toxin-antitoxin system RelE/ParE family toxin [Adlercreutzia sp.]|nr:type II toxin-antitoxin system RelE/ParE family toxin [Adlercreutzia sp.]